MSNIKRHSLVFMIANLLVLGMSTSAWCDTVYTQDGRVWNGLVSTEDDRQLGLDLGFDTAILRREQILRIERSGIREKELLRKQLELKRLDRKKALSQRVGSTKEAALVNQSGHVFVDVVLDGRVKARLFVDTGSTVTFITENIARDLGVSLKGGQSVEAMTSDGRKQRLPLIFLDRIRVGSAEVRHVAVAVLPKESRQMPYQDGLLGMSFLSRFNFKIDYGRNKLVLEPISH